MSVKIATVALGGWYPRGVARMIQSFEKEAPNYTLSAYVNVLPFGAPSSVIENGWDYTGYCAKPFALLAQMEKDVDIGILLDAAFYPIRHIGPLVEHIANTGYYFCRNGFNVGEWSSDRALERLGPSREQAFHIPEISSYCVGLNFRDSRSVELLSYWCALAGDRLTFPGFHTNSLYASEKPMPGGTGRNRGPCSDDPRVMGHRHDQTALSVIAHRLGMRELIERPQFTAYLGHETNETVLVNHGGL